MFWSAQGHGGGEFDWVGVWNEAAIFAENEFGGGVVRSLRCDEGVGGSFWCGLLGHLEWLLARKATI